jgi:tetratricopeptide (TPR) repeat protein
MSAALSAVADERSIEDLLSEGEHLLAEGNKAQALDQFKRATEVDPKSERAWLGVANATGGVDEAIQALAQVILLNPENIQARNRISSLQVISLRDQMNANELAYRNTPVRRYIIPVLLLLDILVYGFIAIAGGGRALGWIKFW